MIYLARKCAYFCLKYCEKHKKKNNRKVKLVHDIEKVVTISMSSSMNQVNERNRETIKRCICASNNTRNRFCFYQKPNKR